MHWLWWRFCISLPVHFDTSLGLMWLLVLWSPFLLMLFLDHSCHRRPMLPCLVILWMGHCWLLPRAHLRLLVVWAVCLLWVLSVGICLCVLAVVGLCIPAMSPVYPPVYWYVHVRMMWWCMFQIVWWWPIGNQVVIFLVSTRHCTVFWVAVRKPSVSCMCLPLSIPMV